jgi:CBS-domain-containing membrane protein
MSTPVVTVGEDTDIDEIARILTTYRIKRVPVVRDGRLVGIVSRADLLRAMTLQSKPNKAQSPLGVLARAIARLELNLTALKPRPRAEAIRAVLSNQQISHVFATYQVSPSYLYSLTTEQLTTKRRKVP